MKPESIRSPHPWRGANETAWKRAWRRYAVPAGTLLLTQFTAYPGAESAGWQGQTQLYEMSELALAEKTNEDKAEAILDEVLAS